MLKCRRDSAFHSACQRIQPVRVSGTRLPGIRTLRWHRSYWLPRALPGRFRPYFRPARTRGTRFGHARRAMNCDLRCPTAHPHRRRPARSHRRACACCSRAKGSTSTPVGSPEAALAAIAAGSFDLLLMDLNYTGDTTSGREGIDLLSRVQALDASCPIVVMTGWGSVDLAVEAMRRGVRDFVQKPWDNAQLLATLRTEIEEGRARRQQVAHRAARAGRGAAHPAQAAAGDDAADRRLGDRDVVAAGVRCRRRLLRRDRVRPGAARPVDRRRRRQRHSRRAADVEPAGRRARLCHRRRPSRPSSASRSIASSAATSPKDASSGSSIACSTATSRHADATANAGHYPPILVRADGSVERLGTGGAVLGVLPDGGYEQGAVALAAATASCSTPTASPKRCNAADEEFGESGWSTSPSRIAACSAPRCRRGWPTPSTAFTGGRFQDDATLIVWRPNEFHNSTVDQ